MPYKIISYKKGNKKIYAVINTISGKFKSVGTTKIKAEKQLRLLRSLERK